MLSKSDLDIIRVELEEARDMAPMQWAGDGGAKLKAATDALAALDRLIESEKCNGWSNWETWNVKLWLDNDEGVYGQSRAIVGACAGEVSAAAQLKDFCFEVCFGDERGELNQGMAADLLKGALDSVNWREITQSIIDELKEGQADES